MRTLLVGALAPGPLTLSPAESHHLLRVLRAAPGARLRLTDGAGHEAEATLATVEASTAGLVVGEVRAVAAPPPRRVLLGLTRPPLVEEAVTLGTELGLTELWLVRCAYAHPGEPRLDRLERVVDAAVKQCRRADRPALRAFSGLAPALAALPPGARYLAAPGGPSASGAAPADATIAVGPEGGWSPAEIDALLAAGFAPLGLALAILRAPTAVAAALAALAQLPSPAAPPDPLTGW